MHYEGENKGSYRILIPTNSFLVFGAQTTAQKFFHVKIAVIGGTPDSHRQASRRWWFHGLSMLYAIGLPMGQIIVIISNYRNVFYAWWCIIFFIIVITIIIIILLRIIIVDVLLLLLSRQLIYASQSHYAAVIIGRIASFARPSVRQSVYPPYGHRCNKRFFYVFLFRSRFLRFLPFF